MVRINATPTPRRVQLNSDSLDSSTNRIIGNRSSVTGFTTGLNAALRLKIYPVSNIQTNFLIILLYAIMLNAVAFILSLPVLLFHLKTGIEVLTISIFTTLLTFAYIILGGVIYRKFLGTPPNNIKTSYTQMMYLCMFSFIYLPLAAPLGLLVHFLGWIFYFGVTMASQYFLTTNIYNVWQFSEPRRAFCFNLLNFIVQFVFVMSFMAVMELCFLYAPK
ncbi:hypothetical protein CDIK_0945 [Cucumispora dikerogammari]|nr:hypothetical protein CDIK_0945 [Cucumispora dikerogammari]